MKTMKLFSVITLFLAVANLSFAQDMKTEALNVSGECGMCKKKIEKAAKDAGATYAAWSTQTKVLTIRYNSLSTNSAKIQQKVAEVGYDTPDFKAPVEAYNKLDKCCQYDRESGTNNETAAKDKSCCDKATGEKGKMDCCKKDANGKTSMSCGDSNKSNAVKKNQ